MRAQRQLFWRGLKHVYGFKHSHVCYQTGLLGIHIELQRILDVMIYMQLENCLLEAWNVQSSSFDCCLSVILVYLVMCANESFFSVPRPGQVK